MTNQTAVVVGVGPGLGLALVKAFANEGYTVFAAAREVSALGSCLVEREARDSR